MNRRHVAKSLLKLAKSILASEQEKKRLTDAIYRTLRDLFNAKSTISNGNVSFQKFDLSMNHSINGTAIWATGTIANDSSDFIGDRQKAVYLNLTLHPQNSSQGISERLYAHVSISAKYENGKYVLGDRASAERFIKELQNALQNDQQLRKSIDDMADRLLEMLG